MKREIPGSRGREIPSRRGGVIGCAGKQSKKDTNGEKKRDSGAKEAERPGRKKM